MEAKSPDLEIKKEVPKKAVHRTLGLTILLVLMLLLSIYGSVLFAATIPEELSRKETNTATTINISEKVAPKTLEKENENNDECLSCHGEMKELFEKSAHNSSRGNAGEGLCLNCHTPHKNNSKSELTKDPILLCKDCHKQGDPRFNHPVGKLITDENKESELTCTSSCHNPHGSVNYAMLRDVPDGLCIDCHQSGELW
ncbi:MAG: cytochrome c3 family protein [Actinobacteria bacterium]|nr:cytochrome c3 family protein [Actinomycetota bacterium]